ncbi:MAG: hypothetical protein ACT6Q8_24205 [Niveispirillum sp.]|uniref:hypothetical protein n=1 Tax=Niveispirillum sp. TaxID=1917217 RepID=UPI004035983E
MIVTKKALGGSRPVGVVPWRLPWAPSVRGYAQIQPPSGPPLRTIDGVGYYEIDFKLIRNARPPAQDLVSVDLDRTMNSVFEVSGGSLVPATRVLRIVGGGTRPDGRPMAIALYISAVTGVNTAALLIRDAVAPTNWIVEKIFDTFVGRATGWINDFVLGFIADTSGPRWVIFTSTFSYLGAYYLTWTSPTTATNAKVLGTAPGYTGLTATDTSRPISLPTIWLPETGLACELETRLTGNGRAGAFGGPISIPPIVESVRLRPVAGEIGTEYPSVRDDFPLSQLIFQPTSLSYDPGDPNFNLTLRYEIIPRSEGDNPAVVNKRTFSVVDLVLPDPVIGGTGRKEIVISKANRTDTRTGFLSWWEYYGYGQDVYAFTQVVPVSLGPGPGGVTEWRYLGAGETIDLWRRWQIKRVIGPMMLPPTAAELAGLTLDLAGQPQKLPAGNVIPYSAQGEALYIIISEGQGHEPGDGSQEIRHDTTRNYFIGVETPQQPGYIQVLIDGPYDLDEIQRLDGPRYKIGYTSGSYSAWNPIAEPSPPAYHGVDRRPVRNAGFYVDPVDGRIVHAILTCDATPSETSEIASRSLVHNHSIFDAVGFREVP